MGFGSSLGSFDLYSYVNDEWYGGDKFVLGDEEEWWVVCCIVLGGSLLSDSPKI